jgi:diguanylate cyclase (GGDEF)-like protein
MPATRITRSSRLIAGLLIVSAATLVFGVYNLNSDLHEAEATSGRNSLNLARAIESEISRSVELYDLALNGAIDALKLPGIDAVSPQVRRYVLFDRSVAKPYFGSMFLADATGNFIDTATGENTGNVNVADRDYFMIQRERDGIGLYLSKPFTSRLRHNEASVALSRRLPDVDGKFAGIVAAVLRMNYFLDLAHRMRLEEDSVITILRADGTILVREPSIDGSGDTGRQLSFDSGLLTSFSQSEGTFTRPSLMDGVRRVYSFVRLKDVPVIVVIGQSEEGILTRWWQRVWLFAGIGLVLGASAITLSLLLRRELRRRMAMEEQLVALARADALTGLANRRAFDDCAQQEWARSMRTRLPLSVLMIDIDAFKNFNDRHGHMNGDILLVAVAGMVAGRARRPADLAARFGGDEFALILPETPPEAAEAIAQNLREQVEASGREGGREASRITLSIGLASAVGTPEKPVGALINAADSALYEAKRSGRNRVIVGRL